MTSDCWFNAFIIRPYMAAAFGAAVANRDFESPQEFNQLRGEKMMEKNGEKIVPSWLVNGCNGRC